MVPRAPQQVAFSGQKQEVTRLSLSASSQSAGQSLSQPSYFCDHDYWACATGAPSAAGRGEIEFGGEKGRERQQQRNKVVCMHP